MRGHKVKIFKLYQLWASSRNACLLLQRFCYRERAKNLPHMRATNNLLQQT